MYKLKMNFMLTKTEIDKFNKDCLYKYKLILKKFGPIFECDSLKK